MSVESSADEMPTRNERTHLQGPRHRRSSKPHAAASLWDQIRQQNAGLTVEQVLKNAPEVR